MLIKSLMLDIIPHIVNRPLFPQIALDCLKSLSNGNGNNQ